MCLHFLARDFLHFCQCPPKSKSKDLKNQDVHVCEEYLTGDVNSLRKSYDNHFDWSIQLENLTT